MSNEDPHTGGNTDYWTDEKVKKYELNQQLLSEKKPERLQTIVNVISYACNLHAVKNPEILDIGCGPGTATTLSKYVLDGIPGAHITGTDASEEMIEVARSRLQASYPGRFSAYLSDFNTDDFWRKEIDKPFDFIVSFAVLHYLSDARQIPFLKEVYSHIKENGAFIAGIGVQSDLPSMAEMQKTFRYRYTYGLLREHRDMPDFEEFRKQYEEKERQASVNWKSQEKWLTMIRDIGFREAEIISHYWMASTFTAIK